MTDTTIENTSAHGHENNSMESGTGDGSNLPATQTDSPGTMTGFSNLKREWLQLISNRKLSKLIKQA
jgi:hypothetical protein